MPVVLEVLPDSSDTEPGDMPEKLTSVNSTSPLAPHQRRNHLDNGQLSPGMRFDMDRNIQKEHSESKLFLTWKNVRTTMTVCVFVKFTLSFK